MSATCPTCDRPVDPLRARAVAVREGRVVAYCSRECARAAESRPTAIPHLARAPESGPVIEIVHEPASGVVTSARTEPGPPAPAASVAGTIRVPDAPPSEAASDDAPWPVRAPEVAGEAAGEATDDAAGEATDDATADGAAPATPARGRRRVVNVLVLALAGAGAVLTHRFLIAPAPPVVTARPVAPVAPPVEPPAPAPPREVVDRATALARAHDALRTHLDSPSPRVQRKAAAALARTGDRAAIDVLAAALAKETTDATRLELAYWLGRAGEARGVDVLVGALRASRRDARIDAGRRLALLGDRRAIATLAAFLEVRQLRLGAAEQLAFLAEPRALAVLEQVRADADASPADKARATIALGNAGRREVTAELHALLADARNNAFAASALARLGDAEARPVLVEQLAIPSLRVEAARSLRRLEPALDPTPLLPALVAALARDKDTEQVQVAEAILLVAGEPAWSERP